MDRILRAVPIGTRLAIVLSLIIVLMAILGATSLIRLQAIDHDLVVIDEHRIPSLHAANELNSQFLTMRVNTANLLSAETAADRQRFNEAYNRAQEQLLSAESHYLEGIQSPEALAGFEATRTELQRYQQLSEQLRALVAEGNIAAATLLSRTQVAPEAQKVSENIAQLVTYQEDQIHLAAEHAHATYRSTRLGIIEIMALATGLAIIIAWLLTRSITTPIRSAVQVARNIADRNLTGDIQVSGRDEATELLNALSDMQTGLRATLSEIGESSDQLAAAAEQLAQVTNDTNAGLQRQTEELELAASAVTEMSTAIDEVAGNVSNNSQASKEAESQSQFGLEQVRSTLNAIEKLSASIEQNASNSEQLANRVNDVASMLEVIQGIAEQTNLLALNAAIEAARAGDQGRGFAVVADEVRALAQRTAHSTTEIEAIITAVNDGSQTVKSSLSVSQENAKKTLDVGAAAGDALERIAQLVGTISERALASASAVEQQATVAREVDRNLTNIKDLSAQAAVSAEETQASSTALAQLATGLNDMVARFKV
ncbi:methyl-accepting chemotaxis protein [Saccharospirillum sp. MSK14-1]|uniref:methyl-accepting chemotaxis protein n=1 Tax=Saccharospirillum sp. MSK14-1 TaxID=1897632 RepID=UPI001304C49C|nr:methyl-accepting chemotaxis protein [Saccharospirillum sp. MSK14-1]